MYSIQALWSAASRKLPITFVLCNNGGYRIIKQRLKAWHGNDTFIGMDFNDPPIDATRLAEGFGLKAHRVETGEQFEARFGEAMAGSEPVLSEAIGRAHVCTPVTNAHLVCRLMLETKQITTT